MKNLILILTIFTTVFFISSCKKSDPEMYTLQGKWTGTYTNAGGGTANYFSMDFQGGGALKIEANSAVTPDLANGSYQLVGDSVQGAFIYTVGIGINYSFSGKFSTSSNIISGTIGIVPNNTGSAVFTVTKQ